MSAKTVTAMCFLLLCLFIKQKSFSIGLKFKKKKKKKTEKGRDAYIVWDFCPKKFISGHFVFFSFLFFTKTGYARCKCCSCIKNNKKNITKNLDGGTRFSYLSPLLYPHERKDSFLFCANHANKENQWREGRDKGCPFFFPLLHPSVF